MGAHSASLCDEVTESDSGDDDGDAQQHHTDPDISSDDATVAADDTDAVNDDCCEVCLVAPRDTRVALVPCGHQRFCASCATEVHNQGRGCPICRSAIHMVLRLF